MKKGESGWHEVPQESKSKIAIDQSDYLAMGSLANRQPDPPKAISIEDNWSSSLGRGLAVCETCMYWLDQRCRRHAPKGQEGWPATYATDFCGDHKLSKSIMRGKGK